MCNCHYLIIPYRISDLARRFGFFSVFEANFVFEKRRSNLTISNYTNLTAVILEVRFVSSPDVYAQPSYFVLHISCLSLLLDYEVLKVSECFWDTAQRSCLLS